MKAVVIVTLFQSKLIGLEQHLEAISSSQLGNRLRKQLPRPEIVSRGLNGRNQFRQVRFGRNGHQALQSLKDSIDIDFATTNILACKNRLYLPRDHLNRG